MSDSGRINKVLVMSDSHSYIQGIENIIKDNLDCDIYVHCGDTYEDTIFTKIKFPNIDIIAVSGNIGSKEVPEIITELFGIKTLITHGDAYNVKNGLDGLIYKAKDVNAKLVLYGHTHIQKLDNIDDIILLNPGNVWKENQYAIIKILNSDIIDILLY